jgi:hypothetical protein
MTTLRQTLANRQNGTLNTGATSPEAKRAASMNAMTHGLAAAEGRSSADQELINFRFVDWQPKLKARGTLQEFHARRYVASTVRMERCDLQEEAWLSREALRSDTLWDVDRTAEAAELAAKIGRKPQRTARKLAQSLHGCDWLLAALRALELRMWVSDAGAEATRQPLDEAGRRQACDLLGVRAEDRAGNHTVLDLPAGFTGERTDAALMAHQAAVIAAEVKRLETIRAGLRAVDVEDREATATGMGVGIAPSLRLIRRYYKEAKQEMEESLVTLRALQADAEAAAAASAKSRDQMDRMMMMMHSGGEDAEKSLKAAAAARAATPPPIPPALPVTPPPSALAAAAAALPAPVLASGTSEEFEAILREVFPTKPSGTRDRDRGARAAHRGFAK